MVTPLVATAPLATEATRLQQIAAWDHWDTVRQVAEKEYGMSAERFQKVLLEYQRFIGLIVAGHKHVGMFSDEVDKIWYSHLLCSLLYTEFSEQFAGRFIHHTPNLKTERGNCVSPEPCASRCLSICKTPPPKCTEEEAHPLESTTAFQEAYIVCYHEHPPLDIWNLLVADGIAS